MAPVATYDFFSQNPHLEPKPESGFLLNKMLLLVVDTRGQQGLTNGKVCSFPQKSLSVWERHFQKVSPQISKANRQRTLIVADVLAAARASFQANGADLQARGFTAALKGTLVHSDFRVRPRVTDRASLWASASASARLKGLHIPLNPNCFQ